MDFVVLDDGGVRRVLQQAGHAVVADARAAVAGDGVPEEAHAAGQAGQQPDEQDEVRDVQRAAAHLVRAEQQHEAHGEVHHVRVHAADQFGQQHVPQGGVAAGLA